MSEAAQSVHGCQGATSIDAILGEARVLVQPRLHAVVETLPAELLRVADFHVGWWGSTVAKIREEAAKRCDRP